MNELHLSRRSSRVISLGLIYNFGKATKKSKDEIPFDNGT